MNAGITADDIAYVTSDPLYAMVRFFASRSRPRRSAWTGAATKTPKVDALINEAKQTFDTAEQDDLIAQPCLIVDDAVLVWVVHDANPRALSPKVKQFVQAQHWFQDLTTIGVE